MNERAIEQALRVTTATMERQNLLKQLWKLQSAEHNTAAENTTDKTATAESTMRYAPGRSNQDRRQSV